MQSFGGVLSLVLAVAARNADVTCDGNTDWRILSDGIKLVRSSDEECSGHATSSACHLYARASAMHFSQAFVFNFTRCWFFFVCFLHSFLCMSDRLPNVFLDRFGRQRHRMQFDDKLFANQFPIRRPATIGPAMSYGICATNARLDRSCFACARAHTHTEQTVEMNERKVEIKSQEIPKWAAGILPHRQQAEFAIWCWLKDDKNPTISIRDEKKRIISRAIHSLLFLQIFSVWFLAGWRRPIFLIGISVHSLLLKSQECYLVRICHRACNIEHGRHEREISSPELCLHNCQFLYRFAPYNGDNDDNMPSLSELLLAAQYVLSMFCLSRTLLSSPTRVETKNSSNKTYDFDTNAM